MAKARPAWRSNSRARPSACSESCRKALSAPVISTIEAPQSDQATAACQTLPEKASQIRKAMKSTSEMRIMRTRPKRSASAPAGGCPNEVMM